MGKIEWKPGNMLYPLPVVMVTVADEAGNDNIITVAWAGTDCTNPPMVSNSVRPERYSYAMLCDTKEVVINLTTEKLVRATDYCGVKSGREVDKFKETGLTREKASQVCVTMIKESPVCNQCRVREKKELGIFDLGIVNRFVYSHGEYYGLGKKLGTFGYSIRKQRKKRQKK